MPVTFPDGSHHDGYSAPAGLEPLRRFVNSLDVDEDLEELEVPAGLDRVLRECAGLEDGEHATEADLTEALALRGALRTLLACNHDGGEPDPEAARVLNRIADRAGLCVRFAPAGWSVVACEVPGIAGAFGRLLAMVADAQSDGTWERLKICPADDCAWAFYDVSRNRSRRWCSMEVCGNRAKVDAYRRREQDGAR